MSLEQAKAANPREGWSVLPLALFKDGSSSGNAYQSWGFNIEDLWNLDTDAFDRRKLKVRCPNCRRVCSPLCSPHTVSVGGGWRWVGLDHREPYTDYRARCPGCRAEYRFTTFIPQ